ncbi:MAG: UDP-N-acetylmuramoyl-L-alanyl-D-glutamate--2,6-diaminopimelate ligase [Desulfomonilia bacterium]|jgi:UDP-N-acetylmuramyl-tripeptide synthetase|nr:UDP-N-acetylmuramoyl-L-alanyl-D-glutamate--2,6-diaminopimelate ligase [Deltaproteobacteria bacterium]MDX9762249.1 UDP-N-acetylmuramoyl-L-alanyl-D-glutamate--2,6-diaminopimelate ligase [Desulfomonilia bacterium]HPW69705.1 UDP-N-acetylmuramoyl-L-alanyl-D-glutamate--2,6-diaminopimelate ligase [Deltaproteobacteria bacterium]
MKASEAAAILDGAQITGVDSEFLRLRANSRSIRPGDAFIAVKGSADNGHRYIEDAVKAGARVIICNPGACMADLHAATIIEVRDTREALKHLLPALYPEARRLRLIGITGTNGKTTTSYLLESVLKAAGREPGVIGTINMRHHDVSISSSVTTPGPLDLFEQLDSMARAGVDTCVMEVSSHSLDQDRVMGLQFDCGIFTNLSQDHLDYHQDMETYFLAKKRLFDVFLKGAAVVNADDVFGRRLIRDLPDALTYGRQAGALIRVCSCKSDSKGLHLTLSSPAGGLHLDTRLMGEVNAYNIMACVGASIASGIDKGAVVAGIEAILKVPGRMEPVRNRMGLTVLVDFAHTPDALRHALVSARSLTKGRLICVFGCGGDRDRTKRPLMGSIAARASDVVIVTSDNPRSEDPSAIIEDIVAGIEDRGRLMIEPDRREAIRLGIGLMQSSDCLLIAGKGHETYQIIGSQRLSFDDRVCAAQCLEEVSRP